MARQVLPIAGAIVGGFLGGPTGAQIGFAAGSIIGGAIDPQVISGPKLGEAGLQTSAEGVFRPIVFAKGAVKGNVIVRGNRQVKTQRTRQGKGGPVTEEQRVYWTYAIRICEGPIANLTRIWQDEKLVYDITPTSPIPDESAEFAERFRLYLGDEDQLPDPDLEAFLGAGNVNAFRGTPYIVFPNDDLTDRRESIYDYRFEVVTDDQVMATDVIVLGKSVFANPSLTTVGTGGDTWSGDTEVAPTNSDHIVAVGDSRFVAHRADRAFYSDDYGQNWTMATPSLGGSGKWEAASAGNIVLIPDQSNGVWRSADSGESYTLIPLTFAMFHIASAGAGTFLGLNILQSRAQMSFDGGLTWADGQAKLIGIGAGGCAAYGDGTYVLGGKYSDADARPAVAVGNGSSAFTRIALHSSNANVISACYGMTATGPVWTLGTDTGDLYYSGNGGVSFTRIPNGFGAEVRKIVFNGRYFIAGGAIGESGSARIKISEDGVTWVTQTQPFAYQVFSLAAHTPATGIVTGLKTTLGAIVSALHLRVGQTTSNYEVLELTDPVEGLVLAEGYTAADAIRVMMPIYFFDASEHDSGTGYRIHYQKRGKPVVRTITINDLLEAPEKSVREDALERPRVMHTHYQNPDVGYAPAKATARRNSPDVKVVGEVSLQVPVVFSDVTEIAQINDKRMKLAWVQVAGEEDFAVHDGHLDLVTGDAIGVVLRGQVRRMVIVEEFITPGELSLKLLADRQSAYTSNVTGVPVPPPTPPLPSIVGQTVHELMDLPALNDGNDRLLWYEAASGQTEAWYGAQTQRKIAPDTEFENSARFTLNTIMGVLMDDVPASSEHYTDTTNTVRVQLYTDDQIDSITDEQFLSEGGSFALKNADGTWEILQYRDSVDEGEGVFALSYLLRGRLNTGGSEHLTGARFVLLDGVQSVDAVTAWIDADVDNRAVSFGTAPDSAPVQTTEWTAKSQTEFPVAHLFGEIAGSTLTLTTVPRHRFGTEDNPVRSINWIGYRWTATDGVNSATMDNTTETIAFDVTGWGSPITATVAQINRFTGPGPAISEDFA